jgi:hypothetical protein
LTRVLQTIYVTGPIFGLDNYQKNLSLGISFNGWFRGTRVPSIFYGISKFQPGMPKDKKTVDQEYS